MKRSCRRQKTQTFAALAFGAIPQRPARTAPARGAMGTGRSRSVVLCAVLVAAGVVAERPLPSLGSLFEEIEAEEGASADAAEAALAWPEARARAHLGPGSSPPPPLGRSAGPRAIAARQAHCKSGDVAVPHAHPHFSNAQVRRRSRRPGSSHASPSSAECCEAVLESEPFLSLLDLIGCMCVSGQIRRISIAMRKEAGVKRQVGISCSLARTPSSCAFAPFRLV